MQFNSLIPELSVTDLAVSLRFYVDILGFRVEYDRAEAKFAFLSIEGAQLMLEQRNGNWETGQMEIPFGRGINFQIEVSDLAPILARLKASGHVLFREPKDEWYRIKGGKRGQRQFLVKDPDGYLLRFCQNLDPESP